MLNIICGPGVEVHAYHPNYLGDRDQGDHNIKPAWAKS
jgi:hypothetical protein